MLPGIVEQFFGSDVNIHIVAIGGAAGANLSVSTNGGASWTARSPNLSVALNRGLDYDGTTYAACGTLAALYTATDPLGTWTSQNLGWSGQNTNGVLFKQSIWACWGFNGRLSTSTAPGSTWTVRTSIQSIFPSQPIYALDYDTSNSLWVAFGGSSTPILATASDITSTFTSRTAGGAGAYFTHAAFGGGYWVVADTNGSVFYGTNPTAGSGWLTQIHTGSGARSFVKYIGGYFVVADLSGNMWIAATPTSTLTSWTNVASGAGFTASVQIFDVAGTTAVAAGAVDGKLASALTPAGPWTPGTNPFSSQPVYQILARAL